MEQAQRITAEGETVKECECGKVFGSIDRDNHLLILRDGLQLRIERGYIICRCKRRYNVAIDTLSNLE